MAKKKDMFSEGASSTPRKTLLGERKPLQFQDADKKTLKETDKLKVDYIDITRIKDNSKNKFDVKGTFFLEKSISKIGLLQPLVLEHIVEDGRPTGRYEIRVGSRRFKAINNLYQEAIKKGNEEDKDRFHHVFAVILPRGATEEEINEAIVETNSTVRQMTVPQIFANFDIIFKKNDNGKYEYLPEGKDKSVEASRILGEMGFTFSKSSVRDYMTIYTSDEKLKDYLEKGFIGKRQALTIARMPSNKQKELLDKIDDMTENEIKAYIKEYEAKKKKDDKTKIRGVDALNAISLASNKIMNVSLKKDIIFSDDYQKEQIQKRLIEIKEYIQSIESLLQD